VSSGIQNNHIALFMMPTIVNPYLKSNKPKKVLPKPKPPPAARHGAAQEGFVTSTRLALKADPLYFVKRDWRQLKFTNPASLVNSKKTSPDIFYVKDLAAWIPHMIVPGYTPSCAKCLKKEAVDVQRFRFVEEPKLLYGLSSHRYLDSACCWCGHCCGDFAAWNPATLTQDGKELVGIINFRLSKGFALDEELYSYVTTHSSETTTSIPQRIKSMHANQHVNDSVFYYWAVIANKVRARNPLLVEGTKQSTLDHLLVKEGKTTREQRRQLALRWDLARLERDLASKAGCLTGDTHFSDVFRRKRNRNSIRDIFPGIGKAKCLVLLEHDVCTAQDLINYDGGSPAIKDNWRTIVEQHYKNMRLEVSALKSRIDAVKTKISLDTIMTNDLSDEEKEEEKEPAHVATVHPFSRLTDPTRYNCRTVSIKTVDCILMNDFQYRVPFQRAKMRSIKATILKLDFHYKIANKIKVYQGRGKSFRPFKCALSIQNEDSLTTFWKCYPASESMDMITPDLLALKERQRILGAEQKVTYVDNCCQLRGKLTVVFPGALVKLDTFHWCMRWDDAMADVNSEKTSIFRTLMRRALFMIEPHEEERARKLLIEKKKDPSFSNVLKEAKATIPPPEVLEPRVMAVMHTCMRKDSEGDLERASGDGTQPKLSRFLKPGAATLNIIINQLEHVKKGCLSDPPFEIVGLHRHNARTKKTHTGRGSSSIEVDNRYVLAALPTSAVGLTRAVRVISDYYEASNDRKRVRRLGEAPSPSTRTEQMQALHGFAIQAGFKDSELLVQPPQCPSDLDLLEESMGFDHALPKEFESAQEEVSDDVSDDGEGSLLEFLQDLDLDEEQEDLDDEQEGVTDVSDADISILLPVIVANETTYETFKRKTADAPWVPFNHPKNSSKFSELDRAEHDLFDSMTESYDRHSKRLDAARGYKAFAKAWDLQVANLFKAQLDGERVQMIHRKSYLQLQEHFDNLKRHKELLHLSNDPTGFEAVYQTFRTTRREMTTPHQGVVTCTAVEYNPNVGRPQFGAPLPLNTQFVANAFQHGTQHQQPMVFRQQVVPIQHHITKSSLGKKFKAKRCCWRCGFQKKEHIRLQVPFGDGCKKNCCYEQCSKCNNRLELLDSHPTGAGGPHCRNETHASCLDRVNDWYNP